MHAHQQSSLHARLGGSRPSTQTTDQAPARAADDGKPHYQQHQGWGHGTSKCTYLNKIRTKAAGFNASNWGWGVSQGASRGPATTNVLVGADLDGVESGWTRQQLNGAVCWLRSGPSYAPSQVILMKGHWYGPTEVHQRTWWCAHLHGVSPWSTW